MLREEEQSWAAELGLPRKLSRAESMRAVQEAFERAAIVSSTAVETTMSIGSIAKSASASAKLGSTRSNESLTSGSPITYGSARSVKGNKAPASTHSPLRRHDSSQLQSMVPPKVCMAAPEVSAMAQTLAKINQKVDEMTISHKEEMGAMRAANEALSAELAEMRRRLAEVEHESAPAPAAALEDNPLPEKAGYGGKEESAYAKPTSLFCYCMEEIDKPGINPFEFTKVFLMLFIHTIAQYMMIFAFFDAEWWDSEVGRAYPAYKEAVEIHNFYVRVLPFGTSGATQTRTPTTLSMPLASALCTY